MHIYELKKMAKDNRTAVHEFFGQERVDLVSAALGCIDRDDCATPYCFEIEAEVAKAARLAELVLVESPTPEWENIVALFDAIRSAFWSVDR